MSGIYFGSTCSNRLLKIRFQWQNFVIVSKQVRCVNCVSINIFINIITIINNVLRIITDTFSNSTQFNVQLNIQCSIQFQIAIKLTKLD